VILWLQVATCRRTLTLLRWQNWINRWWKWWIQEYYSPWVSKIHSMYTSLLFLHLSNQLFKPPPPDSRDCVLLPYVCASVSPFVRPRLYVSTISPVSVDGFSPNLSLVHLGTVMNWLSFEIKGQGQGHSIKQEASSTQRCHQVQLSSSIMSSVNEFLVTFFFLKK